MTLSPIEKVEFYIRNLVVLWWISWIYIINGSFGYLLMLIDLITKKTGEDALTKKTMGYW